MEITRYILEKNIVCSLHFTPGLQPPARGMQFGLTVFFSSPIVYALHFTFCLDLGKPFITQIYVYGIGTVCTVWYCVTVSILNLYMVLASLILHSIQEKSGILLRNVDASCMETLDKNQAGGPLISTTDPHKADAFNHMAMGQVQFLLCIGFTCKRSHTESK